MTKIKSGYVLGFELMFIILKTIHFFFKFFVTCPITNENRS